MHHLDWIITFFCLHFILVVAPRTINGERAVVVAHCLGDFTFQTCGAACDSTCEEPSPICTAECIARCACPLEKPIVLNQATYTCGTINQCDVDVVPTPEPDSKSIVKLVQDNLPPPATQQTFVNNVRRYFRNNPYWPGAGVFYLKNNAVLATGVGNANIARKQAFTNRTKVMVASVSKLLTFTALTILMDEGKFQLDDPVANVLGRPFVNPYFPNVNITWRHFYTHRTGMKRDGPAPYGERDKCPIGDLRAYYMDYLFNVPPGNPNPNPKRYFKGMKDPFMSNVRPGSKSVYSNSAVGFIGVLIEIMTKKPFRQVVKEKIFDKVGMTDSQWDFDANSAVPYDSNNDYSRWFPWPKYCWIDYPNGQLHTSSRDMALFAISAMKLTNNPFYSDATAKLVFTCAERPFLKGKCGGYGLGWILEKSGGSWYVPGFGKTEGFCSGAGNTECYIPMHDGSESGIASIFILNPSKNEAYAVFGNAEDDVADFATAVRSIGRKLL